MKIYRISAIVERDLRKFFRSPALMMTSMVFPLMQLIVLGYAFGGQIKNVSIALVDNDHGAEARLVREDMNAIVAGPKTFRITEYSHLSDAMTDLRAGFVKAIVYLPPDLSSRVLRSDRPRIAFIEDNTDNFAVSGVLERIQQMQTSLNGPQLPPLQGGQLIPQGLLNGPNLPAYIDIQPIEVYPYIEYIKYLLAGSVSISIFVVAMIGGGIVFIDDKARGLHEGYLATPLAKSDLILGLISAGAIKGLMAGLTITMIGGLIAGIPRLWDPRAAGVPDYSARLDRALHDQFYVSDDGPRQQSACSAGNFRCAEYTLVFSVGRNLSHGRFSAMAARDFSRRSIHVRRARAEKSLAEEHGIQWDLQRRRNSVSFLCSIY